MRRQHWFHLSNTFHGVTWSAVRRPPMGHELSNEPRTPRLCVSSTVCGCLAARLFDEFRDCHVYRTRKPRRAVTPRDVWDSGITGETWLIPPVELELAHVLPGRMMGAAQRRSWKMIHEAMRTMGDPSTTPHGRLLGYRDACRVFPDLSTPREREIIELALVRFFSASARRRASVDGSS